MTQTEKIQTPLMHIFAKYKQSLRVLVKCQFYLLFYTYVVKILWQHTYWCQSKCEPNKNIEDKENVNFIYEIFIKYKEMSICHFENCCFVGAFQRYNQYIFQTCIHIFVYYIKSKLESKRQKLL